MFKFPTINKPWGKEEILFCHERYALKRLTMYKNHRCSLQYHEKKTESVLLINGKLKIVLKNGEKWTDQILDSGESVTILPFQIHRMEALEDSVYLEASTPELTDVVRISDDYLRTHV